MGKVINLNKKITKQEKVFAQPNKHYKHSNLKLYNYNVEYDKCLKLFLIKVGEFPTLAELIEMPIYEGRKYIKRLHILYEEKADSRNKSLTGKTLFEEAWEKHMEWYCELTGDTFDKDDK